MLHGQMPLISVIVPIYKVEQYLKQCVESILSQTYTNLEVILVDDGSPDGCPDMCDEFAKEDARIVVIHKENGGLSDARNAGLDIASGEYIGFVDSDDFVASNMYEILVRAAQKNDADIVLCNYLQVDERGEQVSGAKVQLYAKNKTYEKIEFINEILQPYGGYYVVAWNKIYRRSVFENLRFPLGKQHEDEYVFHYVVDNSRVIVSVEDSLYYYRQRKGSIMDRGFSVKSMDYGEALIDRYFFAKRKKYFKWKDMCAYRLSCEFDKWKGDSSSDSTIRRKYEELRKKSKFLICEPAAWNYPEMTTKGKIFVRVEHFMPKVAQLLRKITHKEIV